MQTINNNKTINNSNKPPTSVLHYSYQSFRNGLVLTAVHILVPNHHRERNEQESPPPWPLPLPPPTEQLQREVHVEGGVREGGPAAVLGEDAEDQLGAETVQRDEGGLREHHGTAQCSVLQLVQTGGTEAQNFDRTVTTLKRSLLESKRCLQ